ncbi:hypothetical protein CAP36_17100 [Chitinophagaceae bacterium IBVUCB2]|nr:hypothetical protein CAP36_17100 [Chitinophagaceae bacterium IBVUCB2]
MIKYAVFFTIFALRLFYQPSNAQETLAPFASPSYTSLTKAKNLPSLINFNGNITNNRVLLQWQVSENQAADQFEIEKSTDGKNFSLAALIFGTDKPETDNYWFYEKAKQSKFHYRVKMITKAKQTTYSSVIVIKPNS